MVGAVAGKPEWHNWNDHDVYIYIQASFGVLSGWQAGVPILERQLRAAGFTSVHVLPHCNVTEALTTDCADECDAIRECMGRRCVQAHARTLDPASPAPRRVRTTRACARAHRVFHSRKSLAPVAADAPAQLPPEIPSKGSRLRPGADRERTAVEKGKRRPAYCVLQCANREYD